MKKVAIPAWAIPACANEDTDEGRCHLQGPRERRMIILRGEALQKRCFQYPLQTTFAKAAKRVDERHHQRRDYESSNVAPEDFVHDDPHTLDGRYCTVISSIDTHFLPVSGPQS